MLLRWVYQLTAVLFYALAAWSLIGGFTGGGGIQGILLGVTLALFLAVSGYATWNFAVGPKQGGIDVIGVDEKAQVEKQKSLVRKPQKVAAK